MNAAVAEKARYEKPGEQIWTKNTSNISTLSRKFTKKVGTSIGIVSERRYHRHKKRSRYETPGNKAGKNEERTALILEFGHCKISMDSIVSVLAYYSVKHVSSFCSRLRIHKKKHKKEEGIFFMAISDASNLVCISKTFRRN